MIRVLLAVALAVALLAASLPAIEHAGEERSDAFTRAAVEDLDAAVTDLARSEEAVAGAAGARRVVTVELPRPAFATAELRHLTISATNRSYSYRVAGRTRRTVRGTVPVYTTDGRPLELAAGPHRLVLRLVDVGGSRRVVIERVERSEPSERRSD